MAAPPREAAAAAIAAITPPPKGQRERPKQYNQLRQEQEVQSSDHCPPAGVDAHSKAHQHDKQVPAVRQMQTQGDPVRHLTDNELRKAVRLMPEEVQHFRELFQSAAGAQSEKLHGKVAVAFFSRSGLPQAALKSVWEICDRNSKGHLTRSEFVLAARLVALAQVGMRPTLEQLLSYKQRFPTPKFELPDNIYTDDFDMTEAERAIKHE